MVYDEAMGQILRVYERHRVDPPRHSQPTLEVFDWLKQDQPAQARVLTEIGDHLFEPGYTVAQLMTALRLTSYRFITEFGEAVGLTPWNLIRECRLETAARLLCDTALQVIEITLLVGYDSERAFSALFHDWCGMRPAPYREHARAVMARLGFAPHEAFSWSTWMRFCRGEMNAQEAARSIAILEVLCAPDLIA